MGHETSRSGVTAIIGMACKFPGANNPEVFWSNLKSGVESVRRWARTSVSNGGPQVPDDSFVGRAVLDDVAKFDAKFFRFTPREAELSDPQLRIALECAWEALEHAGWNPDGYEGLIGVYAGASLSSYLLMNLAAQRELIERVGGTQILIRNDKDFIPTTISHRLDLKGPSINISTACSTSLVAIHSACQALATFQCDMALAGGVSIHLPQEGDFEYEEGGIYSKDGRCRAFDARASGTVGGSGAGMVLLKRAEDAIRDGDFIHALILGGAINNDGSHKIGFTAPSVQGQAAVIEQALANAGVEPASVSMIEGHGTGTSLGDPIEMEALARAFRGAAALASCALGSVKTNVGHLDAAAGVAGLMKAALSLREGVIPPSLHFESSNREFDLARTSFYVPTAAVPWPATAAGSKRRAGVSAFGVGGTNAHIVLEEAPRREASGPARPWSIVVLSAMTPASLQAAAKRLADNLRNAREPALPDVAYTLGVGRKAFDLRASFVCNNPAELVEELDVFAASPRPSRKSSTSVIFDFPHFEVAEPGIARDAMMFEQEFRVAIEACGDAVRTIAGASAAGAFSTLVAEVLPPGEVLREAVLFARRYALARLWMSWGIAPVRFTGQGNGEYIAACLADELSIRKALEHLLEPTVAKEMSSAAPVTHISKSADALQGETCVIQFGTTEPDPSDSPVFAGWAEADDGGSALRGLYESLGRVWEAGIPVRWSAFYAHERRLRVPLPTYAFDKRDYWSEPRRPEMPETALSRLDARFDWEALLDIPDAKSSIAGLDSYPDLERRLNVLCLAHLKEYFARSGIALRKGRHRRDQMLRTLGMLPTFSGFLDFMLDVLADEGLAEVKGDEVGLLDGWEAVPDSREVRDDLVRRFPGFRGLADFIGHCASAYPEALSDPRAGLKVLYEDGRGTRMASALGENTDEHSQRPIYVQLAKEIVAKQRTLPRKLRILEIGAGSGILTRGILQALEGVEFSYDFTDVARGFLLEAEDRARAEGVSSLVARRLDIDLAPETQGFLLGSYDLILGLDALHVARDVEVSLRHLKSLLAAGGIICMVEATKAHRWSHMIWGLTEGWWRPGDRFRKRSPLLNLAGWENALRSSGFGDVAAWPRDEAARAASDYGLALARNGEAPVEPVVSAVPGKRPDLADWFYLPVWKRSVVSALPQLPQSSPGRGWLVFCSKEGFGARWADWMRRRGDRVVVVTPGRALRREASDRWQCAPSSPSDYDELLAVLMREAGMPNRIVHFWRFSDDEPNGVPLERLEAGLETGLHALLHLVQALGRANVTLPIRLTSIYNHVHDVAGGETLRPENAAITGALKLIPLEYPNLSCLGIDVGRPNPEGASEARLFLSLFEEADREPNELFAAYRGNNRWVPEFQPVRLSPPRNIGVRFEEGGLYLITGGLGGVGLELADHIAQTVRCKLALVGRSAFPERASWETLARGDSKQGLVARKLIDLEARGSMVMVFSGDVANEGDVRRIVELAERASGATIRGVIHSAAVMDKFGAIQYRSRETTELALSAKVRGALVLDEVLRGRKLDFFVLCSALGAVLHNLKFGEVGYVAANDFLDAFAAYRSAREPGLTVSIGWTDWVDVGMAADAMDRYMRKHEAAGASEHALLGRPSAAGKEGWTFQKTLRPEERWELDGHRIEGKPVLPGTAYLEMAVAAFAHLTGDTNVEMRDVCLMSPLTVLDGTATQVRTVLTPMPTGFSFAIESKPKDAELEWVQHACGHIQGGAPSTQHVDLDALRKEKPLHAVDLTESPAADLGQGMQFGQRWKAIRTVRYGKDWGIAELELPEPFAGDRSEYTLHPAVLDCAFAFLCPYLLQDEPDASYLPVHYRSLRVHGAGGLPAQLVSYARGRHVATESGGSLELDIRVLDASGQTRVEVSGLTARSVVSKTPKTAAKAGPSASTKAAETFFLDIDTPGDLGTLRFVPASVREPGQDEVEIAIDAAALNFKDVLVALGRLPPPVGATFKFGLECAGRITRIGAKVDDLAVGDEVMTFGGSWFAPRVVVPKAWVARKPAHFSMVEAASAPVAFTVGNLALHELGQVRNGQSVLIHCATGGVGLAALQLAREAGTQIHATAGSADKRAWLQARGIDAVYDSRTPAFAAEILERTGGRGVDLVVNSLGGALAKKSLSVLAPNGTFVELGLGNDELASVAEGQGKVFVPLRLDPADPRVQRAWRRTVERLGDGSWKPLPVRVFPLGDMREAFDHMAAAKHMGRIVLDYADWQPRKAPLSATEARPSIPQRSEAGYVKSLVQGMSNREGVDVFARILESGHSRIVVCTQDLQALLENQKLASKIGPQAFLQRANLSTSTRQRPDLGTPIVPAATEVETKLVAIWRDLLGVSDVGVNDNFFDLGGDSLVAIRVLSRCRDEFNVDQTLASLFEHPTVSQLAQQIVALRKTQHELASTAEVRERIVL
jgi:acyl transferase domain-containing protein/SAM-dependent methyltransferase/acyl carrier protein